MSLFPYGSDPSRSSSLFDTSSWEPFQGLSIDGSLYFPRFPFPGAGEDSARVDWKETQEAHVFKADLPGVRKDEIKVEVEDGRVLHISGERSREHEESTDTWHCVERSSGKFIRRFRLPDNAKVEGVKAAMQDGVLTVTVPKGTVDQSNVKSVEISG